MVKVHDIMTVDVLTLSPDMTLREAVEHLEGRGVSGAPVVASGEVVGVISQTDLLAFEATEADESPPVGAEEATGWPEVEFVEELAEEDPGAFFGELGGEAPVGLTDYFREPRVMTLDRLEDHSVGEVMTRRAVAVAPRVSVVEAAQTMMRGGIHRVLVMEGRKLAGILTSSDFVRAVADGRLGG